LQTTRLAVAVGLSFTAIACAPPSTSPGGQAQNAVWTGKDKTHEYEFDAPGNWDPQVVPDGVATIASSESPAPLVHFAKSPPPGKVISEIRLSGQLGLMIGPEISLAATNLNLCCEAKVDIYGTLTGNLNMGDRPDKVSHQVSGGGTINGNITETGGTLSPGSGHENRVLTVKGTYVQSQRGALLVEVWPEGGALLNVSGNASVSGPLVIDVNAGVPNPMPPFKVLTAASLSGCFPVVFVITPGYAAKATCSARDATVTLTRQ
jgi:hypothetical protein